MHHSNPLRIMFIITLTPELGQWLIHGRSAVQCRCKLGRLNGAAAAGRLFPARQMISCSAWYAAGDSRYTASSHLIDCSRCHADLQQRYLATSQKKRKLGVHGREA